MELVLSLADLAEERSLVGLDERRVASQQNVHDHTDGPHVCLGIVGFALQNFGGDVSGRSALGCQGLGFCNPLGKSEIGNLNVGIIVLALQFCA